MIQKRIIVCLDVRDGKTTKGVKFQGNVDIGDPVDMAERYYHQGVDELVFYDITASAEQRGIMISIVRQVARRIFIPFCVGGGIRSVDDMNLVIQAGAEKVSINSSAVQHPELIDVGARRFGSQCIVLGLDALRNPDFPSGYQVVINGGRLPVEKDMLQWSQEAVDRGAGEIVLNSIDADGTKEGYELVATRLLSQSVPVPVVASGGAGHPQHLAEVFDKGCADAALVAGMVHHGDYSLAHIKTVLDKQGIAVRTSGFA